MITNIKHGHQSANQVMMLRHFGEVREGERVLVQRRLISRRHLKHAIKLMYSVCTPSLDTCMCADESVCVCVSFCVLMFHSKVISQWASLIVPKFQTTDTECTLPDFWGTKQPIYFNPNHKLIPVWPTYLFCQWVVSGCFATSCLHCCKIANEFWV